MLDRGFEKPLTLACRFLGLGSRFLLTFLLTKQISLEFQGEYTLISTTITLLIILFGFDFYVHANRQIIKKERNEVFYLKNSLVFYSVSYLLLLPVVWFLSRQITIVEIGSFWVLYFLIVFEHLGQELFRSYIALRKPLFANVLLFLRTGLWAGIVVFILFFVGNEEVTIPNILKLWLVSAILTCILGIYFYPKINLFFATKIDYEWIKKGMVVGLTMFLSTICLKIIEYSDRYLITFFSDKTELGVYALYFQLANLINVVIFTMYISFIYPDIVQGVYEKDLKGIKIGMKTITKKTLILIGTYALASIIFIPFFLKFIDRDELYSKVAIFYVLLFANLLLNISFSFHYLIVGYEKEKLIFKATGVACLVNISANFLLIPLIGIYGAAISLVLGNLCLLIFKRNYARKLMLQWK